jgi:hypothetical protein
MRTPPHRTTPGTSIKDRLGRAPRTRSVIAATGLLVLCVAPFAAARTGGPLREGVRNGTTTAETQVISNIASTTRATGGYSTRQSNLSGSGGGAVYGCRSKAGGSAATPQPQNPCVRANNLSTGLAFEFNASDGDVAGLISVGTGGDTKRPFVTNATGIATGLNADRLDSLDAAAIIAAARAKTGLDADTLDGKDSTVFAERLFAVVNADATVRAHRGLTTTTLGHGQAGFYTLTFDRDITNCAVVGSQGARNNAFAGSRIISVNKSLAAGDEGIVNVRTERLDAVNPPVYINENQAFDVQVMC